MTSIGRTTIVALSLALSACAAEIGDSDGASANARDNVGEASQAWCTPPGVWWGSYGYSIPYFCDGSGACFSPCEGDPPWL